ncbi:MAG: hypothetical protein M1830_003867 [Pleopsidium flavum]|nr:MAG: hypothetical protein M1830_003867 [Pleopsidium flavum]
MASPTASSSAPLPNSILTESTSPSMPWYKPFPGLRLTRPVRAFFETYSGINPHDVESHIISIRDKAWHIRPYPCIGGFTFLHSALRTLPIYASLLPRLCAGDATYLDLGCGLGEELRWLLADGVPTSAMVGVDLLPELWELGFELFRDRARMDGRFIPADIFDAGNEDLSRLVGTVDVLFAGNFFHLFGWEGQLRAAERVARWSKGVGSVACGTMIGTVSAKAMGSKWGKGGSEQFWHDDQSWRRFWEVVERRTATKWRVEVESWRMSEEGEDFRWMGETATRLRFVCVRIA